MEKSPVQIVLNSSDFIETWDRQGGGLLKDFYAGQDQEFVDHRQKIADQLVSLKKSKKSNEYSDISYAKVILKQSALAKSHRPTGQIFRQDVTPIVGGGDLGEIYVELDNAKIDEVTSKVLKAEVKTRWKEDRQGKKMPNPTAVRSEVGAIEEIKAYTKADKRRFSLNDGLKWIADKRTGGGYIVELFEVPPPKHLWDSLSPQKYKFFKSFYDGLTELGPGLIASRVLGGERNIPMISIRLEQSQVSASIQLIPRSTSAKKKDNIRIDLSKDRHESLIKFLDNHPLVRRINLPPIISQSAKAFKKVGSSIHEFPKPIAKKSYPKVAVVDGGVSTILGSWIEERHGLLALDDMDQEHGTFIAGLLVSGNTLNGSSICGELDGCKIIDLDLLPREENFSDYYSDSLQFFDELENAVREIKSRTGVRIFNFSLNIEEHVSTDNYSPPARRLDEIAEANDIIFVISAGNTEEKDWRKEWPDDPAEALKILASSRNDTIKKPAESYRNLSVSALNPPDLDGIIPYSLSSYSCRGPGTRIGLKPDLAHIGGSGTKVPKRGHGLFSIDERGTIVDACGTSYAAPNVAKGLACLDHAIEGDVSRESLIALAVHNAKVPELLLHKDLKDIAKDLVGFGIPDRSEDILSGSDSSITLVFANRIYPNKRLSFQFPWPSSLVEKGKCFGYARLTIVSSPPFDYRYGSEFVRINIEGNLRQIQDDGSAKGRLLPVYLPESSNGVGYEKNRIEHSFKWSPIKVLEKTFRGVGPGSDWRLDIEYLARDGENMPVTGVPFTALLTIADPKKEKPVFNVMRQSLRSQGVQVLDIKTAARISPRV